MIAAVNRAVLFLFCCATELGADNLHSFSCMRAGELCMNGNIIITRRSALSHAQYMAQSMLVLMKFSVLELSDADRYARQFQPTGAWLDMGGEGNLRGCKKGKFAGSLLGMSHQPTVAHSISLSKCAAS